MAIGHGEPVEVLCNTFTPPSEDFPMGFPGPPMWFPATRVVNNEWLGPIGNFQQLCQEHETTGDLVRRLPAQLIVA